MFLKSSSIEEGSRMGPKQSLNGGNLSPELTWGDAPAGTKSFAVTCYDPDAPTGSDWWHWVALDIPADVTHLPEGAKLAAPARELVTDYGCRGFGGACPPAGHGRQRGLHAQRHGVGKRQDHRHLCDRLTPHVPGRPQSAPTESTAAGRSRLNLRCPRPDFLKKQPLKPPSEPLRLRALKKGKHNYERSYRTH